MFFLRSSAPEILKSNRLTRSDRFLQFFALAMIFDHKTAKKSLSWFEACKTAWHEHQKEPEWQALKAEEKTSFIADLFSESIKDLPASYSNEIPWLGFSSGLDSRFLYYSLRKEGLPVNTYTFGQVGNLDWDISKLAASRMNMPTRFFDTSEIQWDLEKFDQLTPLVKDHPVSPRIATAVQLSQELGSYTDLHGYLNDHITGSAEPSEPSRDWQSAARAFLKTNDQFGFGQFVDQKRLLSLLPRRPFDSQLSYDQQLDLGYRQAQRIRPKDYMGIQHICPFTDERWVGFWLNRTHEELSGQKLYIDTVASLDAETFFDLNELKKKDLPITKSQRREFVYGKKSKLREEMAKQEGKQMPMGPTAHFCFFACYMNNPSFKYFVDKSIARIKKRDIFHQSFIDDTVKNFRSADKTAEKMIKGIVSVDIGIASGLL